MKILYFLIPISIVLIFIAIVFFIWSVNNDQYNDLDSRSKHIIFDDKRNYKKSEKKNEK
jgi:cbb3-type cytochrome oxidase maturation protein